MEWFLFQKHYLAEVFCTPEGVPVHSEYLSEEKFERFLKRNRIGCISGSTLQALYYFSLADNPSKRRKWMFLSCFQGECRFWERFMGKTICKNSGRSGVSTSSSTISRTTSRISSEASSGQKSDLGTIRHLL